MKFKQFLDQLDEKSATFKVGDKVKINKEGHEWDGKIGTVVKSKKGDRTKLGIFAVNVEGTFMSDRFTKDELTNA